MHRTVLLLLLAFGMSSADDSCPGLPMCFCNKDKTSVNCEGKHLSSVPESIPNTVVKLYLGHNQITTLNTSVFEELSKLERLDIQDNKLSVIQPYAFEKLSSLSYLDLGNNKLTEIEKNTFSNLKSLDTLYLVTNNIVTVQDGAFVGTEMLTYLSLQSNKLTSIPPLGHMPSLQKLILEGNQITDATFPSSFNTSKKLTTIILSLNSIKSLNNETFEVLRNNSISSLFLSRNKLSRVEPDTFTPFGLITSLKLGTNPLDANALRLAMMSLKGKNMASLDISEIQLNGILPNDTFALLKDTPITTLNMPSNRLPVLPNGAFSGLNKLLHLDLSKCQIQETSPDAFEGLDKLTILILNENKLLDIPKNLPSSLTSLYLDGNEITAIHDKAFSNLAYLQELRIRFNKIQTLEQDSFVGLVQLNKLTLYNNFIAILPGQVFEPLVRLTSLDLAKNNLASIQSSKGRFGALGSLQYLNLADNNLASFQPDLFKSTVSLKYLHLERNWLGEMISGDYGGSWLQGLKNLESLYLMDNKIKMLPDPTFQDLNSLKLLNISNNKLTGWGTNLFKSTQNLECLDLSFNLIATLTEGNMADFRSMKDLNLTGNPFACNCDLRWFRDWMNKTNIILANNASYHCAGPDDWAGRPLLAFDRKKINCVFFTWWQILIACAVAVVVVSILAIFLYRRRWWIKLRVYKLKRHRSRRRKLVTADDRGNYGAINDVEGALMYDAYISCAEEDKGWVLNYLLPEVDNGELDADHKFGGQYRLFYEDRDAEAGQWKTGIIFENLTCSRKMILVLSRNYLNSSVHMFELDLAIHMMYERKLGQIVLIDIGQGLPDAPKIPKQLAHTLRRHDVVEWRDDPDAQQVFKHEINKVLSKTEDAADMDAE